MEDDLWNKARNWLIDARIEEFYAQNKRRPDPFEEQRIEEEITEDAMRDAVHAYLYKDVLNDSSE